MFEKEAEERAERKINNFIPSQWGVSLIRTEQTYETVEGAPHFYLRSLAKMWKEGAEFGYNKAKVEVEDSYRESLCNAELNLASVTEQLEELEKANKWHKVVDGDLPKENNLYLVAIKDNGLAIAYFNGLHWETKFNLGDFGHCLETVIAWCEIPKFEEK